MPDRARRRGVWLLYRGAIFGFVLSGKQGAIPPQGDDSRLGGCRIVVVKGDRAVRRRPAAGSDAFLAPDAVIFGVDFTGPYILYVKCTL